jgi:hypothetical protein
LVTLTCSIHFLQESEENCPLSMYIDYIGSWHSISKGDECHFDCYYYYLKKKIKIVI